MNAATQLNAVSVLSKDPLTVEVSDCIACGSKVASRAPWYEHIDTGGITRYRFCVQCSGAYLTSILLGGVTFERAKARFATRLDLIVSEAVRRAALMDGAQMTVAQ